MTYLLTHRRTQLFIVKDSYSLQINIIHLQIVTVIPMMRTLRQRILSTMMTSRKVRLTPENENSSASGLLFTGHALATLVIVTTIGGSAII